MKKGRNIHYYPGRKKQPYVFEKMIKGKRISRAFGTLEAAERFAANFSATAAEHGAAALFFDVRARATFEKIKAICGDTDPLEAVLFWKKHRRAEVRPAPAPADCWLAFLTWLERSGRSEEHIRSLKLTRNKFLAEFAETPLRDIDGKRLIEWLLSLRTLSPRSVRNLWASVHNFFSWCKSAQRWLADVPEIDTRLLPLQTRTRVEIWTLAEAEKALRFIEKNYPRLVPHYALRLFAGLRTSEAAAMRWEWIDFERRTIRVSAEICKTRDDWLILPQFLPDDGATVFAWLAHYRDDTLGERVPAPYTKARVKISAACGWKQNVLRHTFATMLSSYNMDDGKTILATRHTSTRTLFAHYKGVNQPREDAEKFFALRPNDKQLEFKI